ncbi:MAG TPA: hypothetical protein DIS90_01280 [Cytophagales bacterium]|nr:hypothetical protein [Cytophagales bacterium]
MDTSRQVLRWSIPGWVFLFVLVIFGLITLRTIGVIHFQEIITQLATQRYGVEGAAILAASGIPLGFIIYQIYFYLYGNVLPFHFVNLDRGFSVLSNLPPSIQKQITKDIGVSLQDSEMTEEFRLPLLRTILNRLKKQYRNRNGKIEYEEKLRVNWEIIRYYLIHISIHDKSTDVHREFTSLSDIFHSLGASRVAIFLSYMVCTAYIVIKALIDANSIWAKNPQSTLLGIIFITIIFWVINAILTENRSKAFISSQLFLRHSFLMFFKRKIRNTKK